MSEPIVSTLGIVGIKNRGAYNALTNYEKLNVVTYQGSSYCAKGDTVGNLPTNTTYWDLLAEKGSIGDTGPQGPKPVKGVDYYTASDIADLESTLASDVTDEVSAQLDSLASITPEAVSSVEDMVDTSKIYVLTTDGHWYWYNSSDTEWVDGGVYQAMGIPQELENAKNISTDTIFYTDASYKSDDLLANVDWYTASFTKDDGTRVSNQYSTGYCTTDIFDVIPGATYLVDKVKPRGGQVNIVFFDENTQNGASTAYGWVANDATKEITVPSGKYKMAFNIAIDGGGATVDKFYRITQFDSEKNFRLPRLLVNSEFQGKKIVNLGDSIFGNNDTTGTGISSYLAKYTGATVYNCAFGGTRAGWHNNANWDALSGYKLATAITTNTWTDQDAAMAAATDFPAYFSSHLDMLKSIDFSEVDIVTLSWGSNDFTGGLAPNYSSTSAHPEWYYNNTLRNIIETLETAYPNLKIFIITPFYRFWLDGTTFVDDSNTHVHTAWVGQQDHTLIDFIENAIDAGKATQTPVINTYYNMGFNRYNRSQYYPVNDGAHQNENGRKLIASYLAKQLW